MVKHINPPTHKHTHTPETLYSAMVQEARMFPTPQPERLMGKESGLLM